MTKILAQTILICVLILSEVVGCYWYTILFE